MSISLTPLYKGDGDRDSKGELTEPWASPIISSFFSPLPFGSPKGGYMTLGSNCHLYVRQPVPGPMPEKGTYYLQKKKAEGIMLAHSTHCRRHTFVFKGKRLENPNSFGTQSREPLFWTPPPPWSNVHPALRVTLTRKS